ncbi:MAG: hypothetical protein ACK5V3_00365 [Bdellovibrionales bacterium]
MRLFKFSILVYLFPLFTLLQASPILQPGECKSNPDDKVYLASLKSNSGFHFNRIRQEIGESRIDNLTNTETRHFYFCRVQCADVQSNHHYIWVQVSDSVSRSMDMQGFLCPQVSIENVQIVGSIWGPQPVVKKFEAITSSFFEIHDWLKMTNFQLSPSQTQSKLSSALINFQQVGVAFVNSSSPVLKSAGSQLLEISAQTPNGKKLLLDYVNILNQKNWEFEAQYSETDYFVFNMIKTHARFLQYSHLDFLIETAGNSF